MLSEVQILGRAIKQAQYKLHRSVDTRLALIGTTIVQWDALRAIENRPGASAHTLALATFQSDQAFGTLANRLEAQGLIERRAGHGRRIEHHLTPAGKETLDAGIAIVEEVVGGVFEGFSAQERTTLLELVMRVVGESAT